MYMSRDLRRDKISSLAAAYRCMTREDGTDDEQRKDMQQDNVQTHQTNRRKLKGYSFARRAMS